MAATAPAAMASPSFIIADDRARRRSSLGAIRLLRVVPAGRTRSAGPEFPSQRQQNFDQGRTIDAKPDLYAALTDRMEVKHATPASRLSMPSDTLKFRRLQSAWLQPAADRMRMLESDR